MSGRNGQVEDLSGWLEPIRERHETPALAGACLREGRLVGLGATGRRRLDADVPVSAGDRFHLGSCTKAMTATLTGVLVEEGRLSWETTLEEVFAERVPSVHPGFRSVTVADLLSHRSGLPGRATPEPYESHQRRYWSYSGPVQEQRLALTAALLEEPPAVPPGTTYSYSNLGYIVVGSALEQVTDLSWEELIQSRLFEPLGMESAGFGAPGTPGETDQPWGHTADRRPIPPGLHADNAPVLGPAGRVHSTLRDWARFIALSLRGARGEETELLSSKSFERIFTDVAGQGYGLGWGIVSREWAGGIAYTHTGSNTLWYAVAWLAPERNAALLAATNWGAERAFQAVDAVAGELIRRYLS